MTFGEYLKSLRLDKNLTQKELSKRTNGRVSHAEISRIESGDRKKPSPAVLKAITPHLGVSYQEMLVKAGYIETLEDGDSFTTAMYYDSDGNIVDIVRTAKQIQEKDPDLLRIVERVADGLNTRDISTIKSLMERFTDDSMSETEKEKLRTILELFLKK